MLSQGRLSSGLVVVEVGRQKTQRGNKANVVWSSFGTCQEGWYMRCENYMANKALMVSRFIAAVIVAQVIEGSIPRYGIFFPCLIITIINNHIL